jgi:photosystem II protein
MAARIQFSLGIDEDVVPDVRITRARDGSNGTATFYFQSPKALTESRTEEITGMYLIDDEGQIVTRDVNAKFINGQPEAIEALLLIKSTEDFERFIRFMNRYAEEHDLGFNKSE